jgi:hypothetical protein
MFLFCVLLTVQKFNWNVMEGGESTCGRFAWWPDLNSDVQRRSFLSNSTDFYLFCFTGRAVYEAIHATCQFPLYSIFSYSYSTPFLSSLVEFGFHPLLLIHEFWNIRDFLDSSNLPFEDVIHMFEYGSLSSHFSHRIRFM